MKTPNQVCSFFFLFFSLLNQNTHVYSTPSSILLWMSKVHDAFYHILVRKHWWEEEKNIKPDVKKVISKKKKKTILWRRRIRRRGRIGIALRVRFVRLGRLRRRVSLDRHWRVKRDEEGFPDKGMSFKWEVLLQGRQPSSDMDDSRDVVVAWR